ncbi:hypothetical protein [Clostridium sp.]|uniref:hypothetical protein n=1 Tax=Clostridium sp. TaxID=1506 RepID=UPI003996B85C
MINMNKETNKNLQENLENLRVTATKCVKWEKKNPFNKKAIFLYKEQDKYIYLVEDKGDSFFGYYTKDGFVDVKTIGLTKLNFNMIREVLLKNLTFRLNAIERRQQVLVGCSMQLLSM